MDRKAALLEYKMSHRPMGVFDIRNVTLWIENLSPYGENGYNERKKTREERLRMIAANRNAGARTK